MKNSAGNTGAENRLETMGEFALAVDKATFGEIQLDKELPPIVATAMGLPITDSAVIAIIAKIKDALLGKRLRNSKTRDDLRDVLDDMREIRQITQVQLNTLEKTIIKQLRN